MQSEEWILLDTETTGFAKPTFVVELGAQRMKGWEPVGEPFCELINQGKEIPEEAQRVHGYTQEILERDGLPPEEVYEAFREYADDLPLVSYNRAYDLKQVLYPEWKRIGIDPIGGEGFCALELTQRLLDPVAAGNCKLQTLRQYYRLPQRGAHTAMGDVETVVDLMREVLRPLAEKRGLTSWDKLMEFASGVWYPSKLQFGKFKGRIFTEAKRDKEFMDWFLFLKESKTVRNRKMALWYLDKLEVSTDAHQDLFHHSASPSVESGGDSSINETGLVIYTDPEKEQLDKLIDNLRKRLGETESEYTLEKMQVDYARSMLFKRLKELYEERDLLLIQIDYRRRFIETLTREGEEEAQKVADEFEEQKDSNSRNYVEAEKALEGKVEVDEELQKRVKKIYRRLTRLYHPDKHRDNPEKQAIFDKLQVAINTARDNGNIETLEEIEADPEGFIRSQGWGELNLEQDTDTEKLKELVASLQSRMLETIEKLDEIRSGQAYKLHVALKSDERAFDELVKQQE